MKKVVVLFLVLIFFSAGNSYSQCSICTKTAQQLGEKPARGLNAGIIYLAFAPLALGFFVGYRWWRNNRHTQD